MRIYFARHGESHANVGRVISNRGLAHPLTLAGRAQAVGLARRLENAAIARVYTSPTLRALETSIVVAHQLGCEYEVVDALREFDCGIAEGRSSEDAWGLWRTAVDAWTVSGRPDARIEEGESLNDIRDRFLPFLDRLLAQYRDTDAAILCIAHGGLYWLMFPLVLTNVDASTMEQRGFGYTTCVAVEPQAEGLVAVEWVDA